MKLLNYLHKYFGFNKRERNGIITLLGIILVLLIVRITLPYFTEREEKLTITKLNPILNDTIVTTLKIKTDSTSISPLKKNRVTTTKLFSFDPNTITLKEAKQLGFKDKTANTLIHYREKGGKFKTKEDLKKLYGISEKFYSEIESYIVIEKKEVEKTKILFEHKPPTASIKQIDINTADSIQFVSLPMIGPATTKKILKFRNALGGFYSIEQLKEVYGMKDSVYQLIQPRLISSSITIRKINVNSASYEEFKKHPYINHVVASTIVAYRQKHGNYKALEKLKNVGTIDDALFDKLKNYFLIENY